MFRSNWFDFEAWQGAGLAISSTTSVEAVKMYDAVVSQVSSIVINFFLFAKTLLIFLYDFIP